MGWGWASELARLGHQVTVLTRAANRQQIEANAERSLAGIEFLYYDLPVSMQRLRRCPGGKPIYYVLWQWFAARYIRRRFPSPPFDVVQHVTYVSVRFPSFMGSLGIPFYFGPVSGGEAVPPSLRSGFRAGQRCREAVRDLSNRLVSLDPFMRGTFRQASRILVTRDTLPLLPPSVRHKATRALAVALPSCEPPEFVRPARRESQLRVLYVGRLLDWKGVDIGLHALRLIRQAFPDISFTIAGDGPARQRLEGLCRELELIGAVHRAGWVPQAKLPDYYRKADLLLFPSLRDSGGMAVLEALAHGLPVICTDLGGPGLIVNRSCGRVIAAGGRTREQLAHDISAALVEIVSLPKLLESLSSGARLRTRDFTFERLVLSVYPASSAVSRMRRA